MKFRILFLFSLSLLVQCKDDCETHNMGLLLLDSTDLAMNPYEAGHTCLLVDSLSDTLTATFRYRISNYDWRLFSSTHMEGESTVCDNYYQMETNATRLESTDSSFSIGITLYTCNPFVMNPPAKMICLGMKMIVNDSTELAFNGFYDITGGYLSNPPTYLQCRSRVIDLHSSLILGGHSYIHVYELSEHTTGDRYNPISGGISKAFYSIEEGLLGFVTKTGVTYYRP